MIKVLHETDGQPDTAWVTEREVGMPSRFTGPTANKVLALFIVSSVRIHAWVTVRLGDVEIRTILAIMPGVFKMPGMEFHMVFPLVPFRHPDMVYTSVSKEFGEKVHITLDPENDNIANLERKFVRPGLWFSRYIGGGTLIGHGPNLYIVPDSAVNNLGQSLMTKGPTALQSFASFPDPTIGSTDEKGIIREPAKSNCFIATACYGSATSRSVQTLQSYRDARLTTTPQGRMFVAVYERVSPLLASVIRRSHVLRCVTRTLLVQPLVHMAARRIGTANKQKEPRRL